MIVIVSWTACQRDPAALPAKPRAVELSDDGVSDEPLPSALAAPSAPSAPSEAAPTETATASGLRAPDPLPASGASKVPGEFPLPIIAGAVVEQRYPPVIASTREMQQLVLASSRPIAELAAFYEKALGESGFDVTRTAPQPDQQVLLSGRGQVGKSEAMVLVMRSPDRDTNVVSMTITRLVKP